MINNVFDVLSIRGEAPNDAVVAWLCDPLIGHGIEGFAASIISHLWEQPFAERVVRVQRQCSLASGCRPDVTVQFTEALLVIENKVNAGALRPDQIEVQHRHGTEVQQGRPFYHVLLCPDRFPVEAFCVRSPAFRVLRYGALATLLSAAATGAVEENARVIVRQYAEYIHEVYAAPAPRGIKVASARQVAERVARSEAWSPQEFMAAVQKVGQPQLQRKQDDLLNELYQNAAVEPRFDRQETKDPCYRVYLPDGTPIFKVFADGRLLATWAGFAPNRGNQPQVIDAYKAALEPHCDTSGNAYCYLRKNLVDWAVDDLVRLLQAVGEKASASS